MAYYHGSKIQLNTIEPRPSKVVNNEKVVFATNNKWLSIAFIAKFTDNDIEIGVTNDVLYLCEQYENAFKFLKCSGYVHYVDEKYFQPDDRLGMKNHEFISHTCVPASYSEKIECVYDALQKGEVLMIEFNDHTTRGLHFD